MTGRLLSCADLPEMIHALCVAKALPVDAQAEDMRWHISACPECHAATRPLHQNQPPYCPQLLSLPLALYRRGRVSLPADQETRVAANAMDDDEAEAILAHASSRSCPMCWLWLPRLRRSPHDPLPGPLWSGVLAEELVAEFVPELDLAAEPLVQQWRETGRLEVAASAMSLGFDTGGVEPGLLSLAREVLLVSDSLAWQPPGSEPSVESLDAAGARLAHARGPNWAEQPESVRRRVVAAWRRAAARTS